MSGQLVGGIIGAFIGFFTPIGPSYGWMIGAAIGGAVAPGELPEQYGPRLSDLQPQTSEYGRPIPIVFGSVGMAGNVIWAAPLFELAVRTETGGKGSSPSQGTTQYYYYSYFAVALAEGECDVGRIWAGPEKRLVYDGNGFVEGGDGGFGAVRVYRGTEDQLPDPLLEFYLGVGNVPAYRGTCYVVFQNFPVANDGNRIPFLWAEVGKASGTFTRDPVYLGASAPAENFYGQVLACVDTSNGNIWSVTQGSLDDTLEVRVNSDQTKTQIASFSIPVPTWTVADITYLPDGDAIVVSGNQWLSSDCFAIFNASSVTFDTLAVTRFVGTGRMDCALYNPVTEVLMGFRQGGWYDPAVMVEALPAFEEDFNLGEGLTESGSLGTVWCRDAILAGDNFAVLVTGSTNAVVVRTLAAMAEGDSAAVGLYPITGAPLFKGRMFYDAVRNRIIVGKASGLGYSLIDLTAETVTNHTFEAAAEADTEPAPPSELMQSCVMYRGLYVFGCSPYASVTSATALYVVNPDTLECTGTYCYEMGDGTTENNMMHEPLLLPASGGTYVLSFDSANVKRLYLGGVTMGGQTLSSVVTALSERAGLAGRTDTTPLTDTVDGYAIATQTTVGAAIAALAPVYYFDAVESNRIVKYVKRGGAVAVVIPDADLAAASDGEEAEPLTTRRQMEVELPNTVAVKYLQRATLYSLADKLAKRLIGSSKEESAMELPMVLTDTKAQEVAEVNLHDAWVRRLSFGFSLPRTYSYLEPTDVVVVKGHTMRLVKITATPAGVLKCEAVRDDAHHYTPNVVVTETPALPESVYVPTPTVLELM